MSENKKLKIAVVHDHLGFSGGGERTVLMLAEHLNADFITAYVNEDVFPDLQKKLNNNLKILTKKIIRTRVVRFFWLRILFFLNRHIFQDYDILIASSQTATEAVAFFSKKETLKIVYTHSTPRRVFDMYKISRDVYPYFLRPFYALFARFWKILYLRAIKNFNINIANSKNVRKRIKNHTGGDAQYIIWPPILSDRFKFKSSEDFYLSFGRVDEAKRIDLIVKAFQKMPDKKLIICSGGPKLDEIKELAKDYKNIEILGWLSDEKLIDLVGRCRAGIYIPIDEDAGMTHLELNSAGKPYLGVKEGGLLESSINNETGILIDKNPQINDIVDGVEKMTKEWCLSKKDICIQHAQKYDAQIFFSKFDSLLKEQNPNLKVFGIDASRWEDPRFFGKRKRTGVEMVSYHLIKNLIPILIKNNIIPRIYTTRTIQSLPLKYQKVLTCKKKWTYRCLNYELKNSPVDYFFTPAYYIPKNAPKKSYALIHDVIFRTNPDLYSFRDKIRQNIITKINIKRSEKVFTVSEFSKREIIRECNIEEDKIIALPMGYKSQEIERENNSVKKYILYIGRIEKKKSVDVLINAFLEFKEKHKDWELILAGEDGSYASDIKKIVLDNKASEKIKFLGYVSEEKKWDLLKNASIFVHPSAHEGSSLPILEAFDAQVPVIASNAQVLEEIGKEAVQYFKKGDAHDLYHCLKFLEEDDLRRKNLVLAGKEELKKHNWEEFANKIYKEIIN